MSVLNFKQAKDQLRALYKSGELIPFVGSGFSKHLGLPDWEQLIEGVAKQLDFEPSLFKLHGTFPQLAQYAELRNKKVLTALLRKMAAEFDSKKTVKKRKSSPSHRALASMKLNTIYTTNYDSHIEGALRDQGKKCVRLACLSDFNTVQKRDLCRVVKFHGTLSMPETIILTETRYFDRMALEEATDQRLRADLLSNSFLFMGYSFTDPNIRYIWYRMHKLFEQQKRKRTDVTRQSYLVSFGIDPIQPELLENWNIHVVLLDPVDKSKSLADFLTTISS